MLQSRIGQNISITFLTVFVVTLLAWGAWNGVRAARSRTILNNAKAMTQGFAHFYTDQQRYPSIVEFQDNNVMRAYITNYPPQEFISGACAKNFEYLNPSAKSYELRVCLPEGVDGYRTGWNSIKTK